MKKLFHLFLLTILSQGGFAQAPQLINYQTVVRNATGAVLADQAISLRLSVLQGSANGSVVYSEVHQLTTNDFGLANSQLGAGTATVGSFSNIQWVAGLFFLRTELDVNNGNNFSVMGTQQLVSVPYALYAGNALSSGLSQSSVGCGDTLWTGGGNFIIIPGITEANGITGCAINPIGQYSFSDACASTGNCSGGLMVVDAQQGPNEYYIQNLGCFVGQVLAIIDAQGNITIPSQNIGGATVSGSGQLTGLTGSNMTITYTFTFQLGSDTCTINAIRQ